MPELPEVETTRRGITPHILNQRIKKVVVRDARLRWPVPNSLPQLLNKQTVRSVKRRAKYLLIEFEHGHLIIHLGMSGSLRICPQQEPVQKHDHLLFYLDDRLSMRYNDPRRFGCALWTEQDPAQHELLQHLGPEPFDPVFNADYLFAKARKRKAAIKNFIMDNHVVVGVGNIYANEALFLSGIRPRKASYRLTLRQFSLLAGNITNVLSRAIEAGGTTLRDFVGGDGKPGYFQQTLHVYNRHQQPCTQCSTPIKHIIVGQRSSFYCPSCQR